MAQKEKAFNLRLTEEMYETVKILADKQDISIAQYIRKAVKNELAKEGK